jgi:hypothetical protein
MHAARSCYPRSHAARVMRTLAMHATLHSARRPHTQQAPPQSKPGARSCKRSSAKSPSALCTGVTCTCDHIAASLRCPSQSRGRLCGAAGVRTVATDVATSALRRASGPTFASAHACRARLWRNVGLTCALDAHGGWPRVAASTAAAPRLPEAPLLGGPACSP